MSYRNKWINLCHKIGAPIHKAHTGHAGRGLRPRGAYVVYKLGCRRGGTPPPALSGEASTVANKPCECIRTQYGTPRRTAPIKRNLDTENPRRPVANYSTAGVSRTLPCGRILNSGKPTSYKPAGRGRTSYASRVGFT